MIANHNRARTIPNHRGKIDQTTRKLIRGPIPCPRKIGVLDSLSLAIRRILQIGYYVLLAAVIGYVLIRYRATIIAALIQFWRDLRRLFGRQKKTGRAH